MTPVTTAIERPWPPAVARFCSKHQLTESLHEALRLVGEVFPAAHGVRVGVESDPETDEEAVIIDVAADLTTADALERKREYSRRWVASVPPDVIGKIRLVLDIGA